MDKSLREYHRFRHDLHVVDGVLCPVLQRSNRGTSSTTGPGPGRHTCQGVSGMAGRIDETVFWPTLPPHSMLVPAETGYETPAPVSRLPSGSPAEIPVNLDEQGAGGPLEDPCKMALSALYGGA